jgi:hypothetical protein
MSMVQNLYIGSAGQAVVMSEFLVRGYNVAIPEVDRGDDLFVVQDANGSLTRIQVKASKAKPLKNGYVVQFNIPLPQLQKPLTPDIYYIFVVRNDVRWSDFIVIPRKSLYDLYSINAVGSLSKANNNVNFHFSFRNNDVICSKRSFLNERNDFSHWPIIQH